MTGDRAEVVVEALEDLLDTERHALLSGNLELVGRTVGRKEELIVELSNIDTDDPALLTKVQRNLKRNNELLEEAARGIKSVVSRLADLHRVNRSLETYDSKGIKQTVTLPVSSSLEKRA